MLLKVGHCSLFGTKMMTKRFDILVKCWGRGTLIMETIPRLDYPGTNVLEREDATYPLTHIQCCQIRMVIWRGENCF